MEARRQEDMDAQFSGSHLVSEMKLQRKAEWTGYMAFTRSRKHDSKISGFLRSQRLVTYLGQRPPGPWVLLARGSQLD